MVHALRVSAVIAFVTGLVVMSSPADAACGGGGNDEVLARLVRHRADTIFLARVGERDDSGLVTLHVIERYRGDPAATMQVDDESLPCRSFSDVAGRILVATGLEKADDYEMPPAEPGRWWIAWFHFPRFGWQAGMLDLTRGLDNVLATLHLLPDTAADLPPGDRGPDHRVVLFGVGSAAWIVFAYGWRRRLGRPVDARDH